MVEQRGAMSEISALQKELTRLIEQLAHFGPSGPDVGIGEWFPSIDIFETKTTVVVKVEAPGMSKADLTVVFHGHKLVISGEKKQPKDEKAVHGFLCLERSFGKFSRSIYIEQAVQLKNVAAVLENGVLTITMPKLQDRRGNEYRLVIQEQG